MDEVDIEEPFKRRLVIGQQSRCRIMGYLPGDAESGDFVDFNDRASEVLGYTREEFEGLKIADFEVIYSHEEVLESVRKIKEEGSDNFETKHRTKEGDIRDVFVSARLISIN